MRINDIWKLGKQLFWLKSIIFIVCSNNWILIIPRKEKLNKNGGSCFYLGSSINTLQKIEERLKLEYPKIKVKSFSPPYKAVFSAEENEAMINAVNAFKPDVPFIGMTAPKQEMGI